MDQVDGSLECHWKKHPCVPEIDINTLGVLKSLDPERDEARSRVTHEEDNYHKSEMGRPRIAPFEL